MKSLFFLEYLKNIRTVGAVLPSSRYLARKIVSEIDFDTAKVIVQFGPGTGSFTQEIIARKNPETKLLLIEKMPAFCHELKKQFGDEPNVLIECDSAERLTTLLKRHKLPSQVDYIVSGLPFASLPKDVSHGALAAARAHTKRGVFITFQYTLLKRALFDTYFSQITFTRELRNIPPAYVLRAEN